MGDIRVSWLEAQHNAYYLSRRLKNINLPPNRTGYVLVGRGGVAVACLLCREVEMKYIFYLPVDKKGMNEFKAWFRDTWASVIRSLDVNTLVVIDDINDTGETLKEVLGLLNAYSGGKDLLPITLYKRATSTLTGTIFAHLETSDSYLVFPWETETPEEVPF